MLACARLGSSPVQHDGGAGCEIVAGSVHLLAGLVQREPEADEARTDGQAEFQQEAEEEVVLGLWIRERQESDTGTSPAQPPRREPSEAAVQIRDVVLWTCPAGIVVLRASLRDHDEIWLGWLVPRIRVSQRSWEAILTQGLSYASTWEQSRREERMNNSYQTGYLPS